MLLFYIGRNMQLIYDDYEIVCMGLGVCLFLV